ncbi:MAG: helix-turn-helix transcriptional regulator [Limosilactobacillus sp.]|uniref:helix-turn-helix domain-containing protein n=1 Tax=Limosilactobacillus sp. TaxID=2773925 RepID=UPI0027116477|nr:helix-turn-helix transcriptional regulator [Limosilactobacillus sp.]
MIGDRIRELPSVKKITQTELAHAINASQQAVTKWENGYSEPTSSMVYTLAKYFNVSADYLLGNTDVKLPNKDLSKNQILITYSIDPNVTDEERNDIIELVRIAMTKRRRI